MEKKYRLKEEVKKYFSDEYVSEPPLELIEWLDIGVTLEALEEVPQRVELYSRARCEGRLDNEHTKIIVGLQKVNGDIFTEQEKVLCEKALNGELLDIDSLDDDDFNEWYFNGNDKYFYDDGIKAVLKQYLKKKNK